MAYLTTGTGAPYATVQAAVTAAAHGDTIGVGPNAGNTYPEAIAITNKYLNIVGLVDDQGISLPGAGGGVAPTVSVTGTGGVNLENFLCSNVGSAHADVLSLNVYQHMVRRVRVDGTGGKNCFVAQYLDNCMAYDGLNGFVPSCPGENILRHFTCVDMSGNGIQANVLNGTLEACLVFNCVGPCVQNANEQVCKWNAVSDATACGADARKNISLADADFVNYGAGDIRLNETSGLYWIGMSPLAVDYTGKRRQRFLVPLPRVYAGAFDPWPVTVAFFTGTSGIRVLS